MEIRNDLIRKGEKVLVGISGGADSVTLLHLLASRQREFGFELCAAHLNHQLRPGEAENDQRLVERLCRRLGVPLVSGRIDGPVLIRQKGLSAEDALRRARYEFLRKAAKKAGAGKIALAHTRDDQAETVLMRIIRGAGLRGLAGIPAARSAGGVTIVRPLLNCRRKELEEYLRRRKIRWREDSSNRDPRFLRNRVRQELLPLLERNYNPGIRSVLTVLAENSAADYAFLAAEGKKALRRAAITVGARRIRLSARKFFAEETALRKEIFRQVVGRLKGDLQGLTYRHWQELDRLPASPAGEKRIDLPGGIRMELGRAGMVFFREEKNPAGGRAFPEKGVGACALKIPGTTRVPAPPLVVRCRLQERKHARLSRRRGTRAESFDYDRIRLPLAARSRRPGDRMRPLGMKKHKRLQDLFIDEKIPRRQRDRIPVFADGGGEIIWVAGVRMGEAAKVRESTRRVLRISVRPAGGR